MVQYGEWWPCQHQSALYRLLLQDMVEALLFMASIVNEAPSPSWVLCHEYRRSKRRCVTVREMKEGPSRSAIRC